MIASYLFTVLKWGPEFMRNRKPYDLRAVMLTYNAVQVIYNVLLCILVSYISQIIIYKFCINFFFFNAKVHLLNTSSRPHIKLHKARFFDCPLSAAVLFEQILGSLGHHHFCVPQETKPSVFPPRISSYSGDWWLFDCIKFA